MARYNGAHWRPIPENGAQPIIRATQLIFHVSASEARSLEGWWNSPGNDLESHLHVARDGYTEQYIDTARSADANYLANRRPDGTGAISVETQGGDDEGEWTTEQVDRLVDIARWANRVHGVPLRLCRNPADPGIGWHVMWGAPGACTPVHKVCPGPARIRQVQTVILPRLTGAASSTTEEDEMNAELDKRLTGIEGALAGLARSLKVVYTLESAEQTRMLAWRPRDEAAQAEDTQRDADLAAQLTQMRGDLDAALAALGQPATPTTTGGTP